MLAFLFGYSLTSLPLMRAGFAVHETGVHGGPPVRVVGAVTAAAAIFGVAVLLAEAIG